MPTVEASCRGSRCARKGFIIGTCIRRVRGSTTRGHRLVGSWRGASRRARTAKATERPGTARHPPRAIRAVRRAGSRVCQESRSLWRESNGGRPCARTAKAPDGLHQGWGTALVEREEWRPNQSFPNCCGCLAEPISAIGICINYIYLEKKDGDRRCDATRNML